MNLISKSQQKALIENNSKTDVTVQIRNSSVNGYMVETMMSEEIVAGKKSNAELIFMNSELNVCKIDTIADMEFAFHVFTTDDWKNFLTRLR